MPRGSAREARERAHDGRNRALCDVSFAAMLVRSTAMFVTVVLLASTGCDKGDAGDDGASTGSDGSTGGGSEVGTSAGSEDAADDSSGGGSSACVDAPADDTACIDFGGTAVQIPMGAAIIGTGSAMGQLSVNFSQDGINMPPSLTINYALETQPGMLDCATAPTAIGFTEEDGTFHSASPELIGSGASCTITLESTGSTVGSAVEGSFEGVLHHLTSGTSTPVSGRFKTSVLF
jgi:hypothetical protein